MDYKFKNLVFEGGGVKGIAYGGALKVLDQMKILPQIERVAGTSAGAINAALLSLGYSFEEVSEIIASTNFKEFEDKSGFVLNNMLRIIRNFGWFKGDAFTEWIGDKIKKKTGKENFTFAELAESVKLPDSTFRSLYLAVTNLSQQKIEIFSHEDTPSIPIRDVVRMSMSIPFYFKAIRHNQDVMVDGGVAYNYPLNLFDNKKYMSNPKNNGEFKADDDGYVYNFETLGFRLDSKASIQANRKNWSTVPMEIKGIKDHAIGLLNFLMELANKAHLTGPDWNRSIFIDTLNVKTTEFDLPKEKIDALIESGKTNTEKYFKWRDTDPEWGKYPC